MGGRLPVWSEGSNESYYCNTIPTPDGGTHEAGLRAALTKGIRAFADLIGQKKARDIIPDDVLNGVELMLSVFIRNPHFQSQTKDRLTSLEAARFVEAAVREDGRDPMASEMVTMIDRVRAPMLLLTAERGLLNQPEPLMPRAAIHSRPKYEVGTPAASRPRRSGRRFRFKKVRGVASAKIAST